VTFEECLLSLPAGIKFSSLTCSKGRWEVFIYSHLATGLGFGDTIEEAFQSALVHYNIPMEVKRKQIMSTTKQKVALTDLEGLLD
jgi:hypothetical protein